MDHSLRLLARMIVRRHFASQASDSQGNSNGAAPLRDAGGNGREPLVMDEDDLLTGRPSR